MNQKNKDYYRGLIYCMRNDIENAVFYLERAAHHGKKEAIETLQELKDKNLLPQKTHH